jgi:hypothetical protein
VKLDISFGIPKDTPPVQTEYIPRESEAVSKPDWLTGHYGLQWDTQIISINQSSLGSNQTLTVGLTSGTEDDQ